MEKCHQNNETADCTPTHYEWKKGMKRPVSNCVEIWKQPAPHTSILNNPCIQMRKESNENLQTLTIFNAEIEHLKEGL